MSNSAEVLSSQNENKSNNLEHFIAQDELNKTLGIYWKADEDSLHFHFNLNDTSKVTKRIILSGISKLYDPLGLVGPCVVKAKILMQRLWKMNLTWDESVPNDIHTLWLDFVKHIRAVQKLNIPRRVVTPHSQRIQIHGFSDASEVAYGASIYIRSTDSHGNHHTNLLCSKSRIAPLKIISLPKLELCGAVLLTKLIDKVKNAIKLPLEDSNVFY